MLWHSIFLVKAGTSDAIRIVTSLPSNSIAAASFAENLASSINFISSFVIADLEVKASNDPSKAQILQVIAPLIGCDKPEITVSSKRSSSHDNIPETFLFKHSSQLYFTQTRVDLPDMVDQNGGGDEDELVIFHGQGGRLYRVPGMYIIASLDRPESSGVLREVQNEFREVVGLLRSKSDLLYNYLFINNIALFKIV